MNYDDTAVHMAREMLIITLKVAAPILAAGGSSCGRVVPPPKAGGMPRRDALPGGPASTPVL